jgi:hypothetical protein
MTELMQTVAVGLILLALIVAIPWSIVMSHKQSRRSYEKGRASAAVGNALQDLDRLVTRPSVEYRIEAENYVQNADDDQGGG